MKIPLPDNIDAQQNLGHTLIIKRSDGIIELRCSNMVTYTPDMVKENHEWIEKFADGKKALVLTITGHYTLASPEARRFTANGPHKNFVAAEAFLIRVFAQRVIATLFMRVNRPIVPAKVFSIRKKDQAEKWLRQQKT